MTAFALKCIALGCMVLDHVGYLFFPQALWLRVVGRVAFPLYAFLLGEGFLHTRDRRRYLLRLLLFAALSEAPFDLMLRGEVFSLASQNVLFTLLLGLGGMWAYEWFAVTCRRAGWGMLAVVAACLAAEALRTDYGALGVLMIFVLYVCREKKSKVFFFALTVAVGAVEALQAGVLWMFVQCGQLLALLPILLYNGAPGRWKFKYFFYVSYPAHMLLLYVIYRLFG